MRNKRNIYNEEQGLFIQLLSFVGVLLAIMLSCVVGFIESIVRPLTMIDIDLAGAFRSAAIIALLFTGAFILP